MIRIPALALAFVLTAAAAIDAQNQPAGFDLKAWKAVGDANWKVVDGIVEADMGTGFLVTPRPYRDFTFTADFWVTADANSGVFIRCQDANKIAAATSYEVNIFDQRPDQAYRTGGIVDVAKPMSVINTGGKWNTIEITAKGPRMTVRINGMPMVDVEHAKFANGPIALQRSAGTVRFRNVRIREL
jgi:hypothetical protein